jgi:hypothetical protein
MKKTFLSLCIALVAMAGALPLTAGNLYVSPRGNDANGGTREAPFFTIDRALREAREWRRLHRPEVAGGITIYLSDGVYPRLTPLFVRPEDSGTADSPTLICAADGAHPLISGGVEVKGWKQGCDDARIPPALRKKIWSAPAPCLEGRLVETRQLWVDGRKAQRASQHPDGVMERMIDFNPEEQTITIPSPKIPLDIQNARQLEMIVHQRWAIAILRVKSLDRRGDETLVRFRQPESGLEFAHPWPQPVIGGEKGNSAFCLTNALQLLDQPGEWFQDYPSGTLYYYPREGEDLRKATVVIPAVERLLTVEGTLERPVQHLRFRGITFAYTAWNRPSLEGYVSLQGGFALIDAYKLAKPGLPEKAELENQAWIRRPEAAIRIRGAADVDFDRCLFTHLAATGLDYEWAATTSSVTYSRFEDIGGTALMIGAFPDGGFETHVPYLPHDARVLCSDITVANNLITDATNEDWGCVGIAAGYVHHVSIVHNEVCHVNYSGICVGWGWTALKSGMESNRIEVNYVHHFATRLYDAGGIYTLSYQPGSVMRGNRIEHLIAAPYATNDRAFYIYLDEATDGYTIDDNWCPEKRFGTNRPGPHLQWGVNGPDVPGSVKRRAGIVPLD